jgi:flagellar biogenesis protein FliO
VNEVDFGDLLLRMVVSLAVVLLIVWGAYRILRRRQGFGPTTRAPRRGRGIASWAPASRGNSSRRGLKMLGRIGLSRTSSVVAIQFAERVYMVAASEQAAPAVLAEIDLESWTTATEGDEAEIATSRVTTVPPGRRPNLLEALREITARRG